MSDTVTVDNGEGTDYIVLTDEVNDPTLGTAQKQLVSLVDGTIGSTTKIESGGGVEAGALRVTIASDSTGLVSVDDGGGSLTVDGTVAVSAIAGTVGVDDDGGSLTVDDGGSSLTVDDGAGSLTVDAPVGTPVFVRLSDGSAAIATLPIMLRPQTSGGWQVSRDLDLDETETEVKGSAGQIGGWFLYNNGADVVYIKLYNDTAANVAVGTTVPKMVIALPGGAAANIEFATGIEFDTAICAAATTGVADNDTTAPAANQVVANFLYK